MSNTIQPRVDEYEATLRLANRILDQYSRDLDDNGTMLARQFLRAVERCDAMAQELGRLHGIEARAKALADENTWPTKFNQSFDRFMDDNSPVEMTEKIAELILTGDTEGTGK